MSADIALVHSAELPTLPEGHYIAALDHAGNVTEATGPYHNHAAACAGMTRRPIPDWLMPEPLLHAMYGVRRYAFDVCPDCARPVEYVNDQYRHVDPSASCFLYPARATPKGD